MAGESEVRKKVEEALASESPSPLNETVLTGWVVVAEYIAGDGTRWLTRVASDGMTTWQREGFLFNALHSGGWEEESEEDTE